MRKSLYSALLAIPTLAVIPACGNVNCSCPAIVNAPVTPVQEKAVDLSAFDKVPVLDRDNFNRVAAIVANGLYWAADENKNGRLDPEELAVIAPHTKAEYLNADGSFNDNYKKAYLEMAEQRRQEAVRIELNVGHPALVYNNLKEITDGEKEMVKHIAKAAKIIEKIYAEQQGTDNLDGCFSTNDQASRSLYDRNQSWVCEAPGISADPFCNACVDFRKPVSGLYPADMAANDGFCEEIAKEPNATEIFSPFTVVRKVDGKLTTVPYNQVWGKEMAEISQELKAAAAVLPENEGPFKEYLLAAAQSFLDNNWEPADEAWSRMNVNNSRWYLRIGPDEVYFEPCNQKAGFHVSFALIDKDSIYWQERLTTVRQDMEQAISDLAPVYKARDLSVHLPDFIEIVINAGNSRNAMGATVGQSLPNWGKVSQEGRSRTVVMSNLYTDPDSLAVRYDQAISMFGADTMKFHTDEKRLALLDIIIHELTHNLGPHTDYVVDGKNPGDNFSGMTATILEELKAQTGALFFVDFLKNHNYLSEEDAAKVYTHSVFWSFGHLSRGLKEANGKPKPYSMLSGIQLSFLQEQGAVEWVADELAANGKEKGYFKINYDKMAEASAKLMKEVVEIKVTGDNERAVNFIQKYTDGSLDKLHLETIAERLLRYPKNSFVYSYDL